MSIYVKLPKTFIKENANTKNKKMLMITYLYFHTTFDKEIYTSIDCICSELQWSIKSHGERRNQNIVKDILQELIKEQIISFVSMDYCKDFDNISNSQLFKLSINYQSELFNPTSNYVRIEKNEFDKIMNIKHNSIHKIFNIFYRIKSYVCMDDKCLHMCFASLKTLCKECQCSYNTLANLIKLLYSNQLIYMYRITETEQMQLNTAVDYVFALENYPRDAIIREFK
jgi:hypothetical protein